MEPEPAQQQSVSKGVFLDTRDAVENVAKPLARFLPHPNTISGPIRTTSAGIDILLHTTVGPIAGTIGYAVTSALDWLDGFKARKCNLCTMEGARLDSNADKLINSAHLLYLMQMYFHSVLLDIGAMANIVNDLYSAQQRGSIIDMTREGIRATINPSSCTPLAQKAKQDIERTAANVQGKVKMILQCIAIGTMMLAGEDEAVRTTASIGLLGAAGIGFIGTLKRQGIDILAKLRGLFSRKNS
ncbi:MAG: hypothetical protein PHU04_02735 [Candidatus Peribacteraceae bacterium]|nr:hypothetical protein [Candidatus Peribacteraceae bacterium]